MRQYIFLNQSEAVLFYRGDATKFVVNEDRYSLNAEFPHDSEKLIEEHMLLGFTDIDGQTQLYEIRTVNTSPFSDVDVVFAEHAAMTEVRGLPAGVSSLRRFIRAEPPFDGSTRLPAAVSQDA